MMVQRKPQLQILKFLVKAIVLIVVHQLICVKIDGRNCPIATSTITYVPHCPMNKAEWKIAATKKNCSDMTQSCVKNEDFQYHCVVNSWINATMEVCAPTWYCMGYCAEFNIRGERIQDNFNAPCTSLNNPCPARYLSSESYLYKGCYELVQKKDKGDMNDEERHSGLKEKNILTTSEISAIAISSVVPFMFIVTTAIIFVKRKSGEENEGGGLSGKEENNTMFNLQFSHNI
ncbi:uncharacterized protein LOC134282093 [Saccostrea cucullata]|uniref:uncharacterized protein LOC134282093 n=1 Tax=Saccostrea cuccullata TaxID=36930 RepID=UPI002ECFF98D